MMDKATVWLKGQFGISPFYDKVFNTIQEAGFWISGYGNDQTGMFITFQEENPDKPAPKEEKMSGKWSVEKDTGTVILDENGSYLANAQSSKSAQLVVDKHNATLGDNTETPLGDQVWTSRPNPDYGCDIVYEGEAIATSYSSEMTERILGIPGLIKACQALAEVAYPAKIGHPTQKIHGVRGVCIEDMNNALEAMGIEGE